MIRAVSQRRTSEWSGFRCKVVGLFFMLVLFGLWARAFHIQILQGKELSDKAQGQYWAKVQKHGQRGEIFDRNGILLAQSVKVRSLYARPQAIKDVPETARAIAKVLKVSRQDIEKKLQGKKHFVWIARKIGDRETRDLAKLELEGVGFLDESERIYPQGHLVGQLLGMVGLDNNGLEGLERSYDSYLKGDVWENIVQKDAAGNHLIVNAADGKREKKNRDLYLTIDSRIQFAVEESLARAVVKHDAANGMSIVVDVHNGEILAWANYPFFNPNNYKNLHPRAWRNRIALDLFEPGSTMKPFLIAAALEEGVSDKESIFFCEEGKWEGKGYSIQDTHEYGWLSVDKIMIYSSNICAAKIGMKLGAQKYYEYLHRFGFGKQTNLDLPGESKGIIRKPKRWKPIDLATASFGQGIAATTLQMAKAYVCLARNGESIPLSLIKRDQDEEIIGEQVVSPEVAKTILAMLENVVEEGTGKNAAIQGLTMGGKTGTAQKASAQGGYGEEHIASFVGLVPAKNPKYVIMTVIDEPQGGHYGGVVAAPVVRQVALELLSYRGEFSELAYIEEGLTDNSEPIQSVIREEIRKPEIIVSGKQMPDVRGLGLRDAVEKLIKHGIVPQVMGNGVVVDKQRPLPGEPKPDDKTGCFLWLGPHWKQS